MGSSWGKLARLNTSHGEQEEVEQVLHEAMAIEQCQLLLRRWERQWCVLDILLQASGQEL